MLAESHLSEQLPKRWSHVQGVARRAAEIAPSLPAGDASVLIAATWLHDIGYAPDLNRTGAHQLDGAALLRTLGQERLAALVAHHSESRYEIDLLGLSSELATYADEDSAISDALTCCDLTTSPTGSRVEPLDRLGEVRERYGEHHIYVKAQDLARPHLLAAVARTVGLMGDQRGDV